MEAVIFDGKEYTKASVVAKKFGYTADYLGQLCRGKKVDARMVGRSWYINVDSLDAHRDARYKTAVKEGSERTISLGQVDAKKPRSHYLSRIDVEPILKKKTVSLYQQKNGTLSPVPVKYEADEYSLIPRVNREAVSKSIAIKPAEAEELKVTEVEKKPHTFFKPEDLPEVYLRGKISVEGLEEVAKPLFEDVQESSEVEEIQPEIKISRTNVSHEAQENVEKPRVVKVKLLRRNKPFKTSPSAPSAPSFQAVPVKDAVETAKITPVANVSAVRPNIGRIDKGKVGDTLPASQINKTSSAPAVTQQKPLSFKPESVKTKEQVVHTKQPQKSGWFLPVSLVCVALIISTGILVLSMEISVSEGALQVYPKVDFLRLQNVVTVVKTLLR